jgi:hypothetical protein
MCVSHFFFIQEGEAMTVTLKNTVIAGLAALTLGATAIVTTSPAEAFGYRGGGFHGGRGFGYGGVALGLGLAGAAIASGAAYDYYHRPYGYYGGYYGPGPYGYRAYGY